MKKRRDWITLDYLEMFCLRNQLIIGCRGQHEDEEVWVSALGPHPSQLTSREIQEILKRSLSFELRQDAPELEEADDLIEECSILSRSEMEQRLRRLMN